MRLIFPDKAISAVGLAIIGAAIVLLIAGILYFVQQERQRTAINTQTERTNQLIEEVKHISEENIRLNEQNRRFSYCNAVLFAKYTQDQSPIVIKDLDKCIFESSNRQETQVNDQSLSSSEPQILRQEVHTQETKNESTDNSSPEQPVTPPFTPDPTASFKPQPLLKIPNVLELNKPCLSVIQLIKTCK